jgi:hypothetical protein
VRATARYLTSRRFAGDLADLVGWFEDCVKTHVAAWIAASHEPLRATLVASPAPEVGSAGMELPFSSEALRELVDGVRDGRFDHFLLDITDHGSGASAREIQPRVGAIIVDLWELDALVPRDNVIEVMASPDMLKKAPGLGVLKGCLLSAGDEIGGGNGALRFGSSFEHMLGHASVERSAQEEAVAALRHPERWLQGVYWGNVLGPVPPRHSRRRRTDR